MHSHQLTAREGRRDADYREQLRTFQVIVDVTRPSFGLNLGCLSCQRKVSNASDRNPL